MLWLVLLSVTKVATWGKMAFQRGLFTIFYCYFLNFSWSTVQLNFWTIILDDKPNELSGDVEPFIWDTFLYCSPSCNQLLHEVFCTSSVSASTEIPQDIIMPKHFFLSLLLFAGLCVFAHRQGSVALVKHHSFSKESRKLDFFGIYVYIYL